MVQCGVCLSACWECTHQDPCAGHRAHGATINRSLGTMPGVTSPVSGDMTKHAR